MKRGQATAVKGHCREDSTQQLRQPRKHQAVRKVEIFMHNLDQQITNSYAKLKKNKQRLASAKKEPSLLEETAAFATSTLIHPTQESYFGNSLNVSPPHQQEEISSDSQIRLLDNEEVMEYIYIVYDLYNIRDPLGEIEEVEKYKTNKKIRSFKDNFQREIGSASTHKNANMYKSIQLNPFPEDKKIKAKRQSSAAKMEVVSLLSKNHQKEKEQQQKEDKPITYRLKNKNVLSRKQKIVITSSKANTQTNKAASSIPQLFRFCFMCEEPILQCNLLSHQQTCEPLKAALQKTFEELIECLDRKISCLVDQINKSLIQRSEKNIAQQFHSIKQSVKNWMFQLPSSQITRDLLANRPSSINQKWRGEFDKIEECIGRSFCASFQLLHKLQWFSKLRQNIAFRFFANQ